MTLEVLDSNAFGPGSSRTYNITPTATGIRIDLVNHPEVYLPVLAPLGGAAIPDGVVDIDGRLHHGVYLEFGPASVDGWLTRIAADELGLAADDLLDVNTREGARRRSARRERGGRR